VLTDQYALINLSKNSKAAAEITRYFSDNLIIEYPDVESYNKHLESFSTNRYDSFFSMSMQRILRLGTDKLAI